MVDILYETADRCPHAPAIDDGTVQLTYSELIGDIEESVGWLAACGISRGDRIGIRMPSGSYAALGARIDRGAWCEPYWLPQADLVTLGTGGTVNRGCVLQTHLLHDRIMRMDTVMPEPGATLGPRCVALPAARLGAGSTVGPASLVMPGDELPASTRWQGNPIVPWIVCRKKGGDDTTSAGPAVGDAAA